MAMKAPPLSLRASLHSQKRPPKSDGEEAAGPKVGSEVWGRMAQMAKMCWTFRGQHFSHVFWPKNSRKLLFYGGKLWLKKWLVLPYDSRAKMTFFAPAQILPPYLLWKHKQTFGNNFPYSNTSSRTQRVPNLSFLGGFLALGMTFNQSWNGVKNQNFAFFTFHPFHGFRSDC